MGFNVGMSATKFVWLLGSGQTFFRCHGKGSIMSRVEALAHLAKKIQIVSSEDAKADLITTLLASSEPTVLAFVNAHAFNMCWDSQEVTSLFGQSDVLLRDGKGLEILFNKSGRMPGLNMNGTDFIPEILEQAKGMKIAVFGTRDPWLTTTCDQLEQAGHNIVAKLDGFQDSETYIASLKAAAPQVVVLAQGMPRQETVAQELKEAGKGHPMLIVCGGAIVDFLGGRFPRAPIWMQKTGMEWAYRLGREPKRLFQRYVIGNFKFLNRTKLIAAQLSTSTPNLNGDENA